MFLFSLAKLNEFSFIDGARAIHIETLETKPQDFFLREHAVRREHPNKLVELDRSGSIQIWKKQNNPQRNRIE